MAFMCTFMVLRRDKSIYKRWTMPDKYTWNMGNTNAGFARLRTYTPERLDLAIL